MIDCSISQHRATKEWLSSQVIELPVARLLESSMGEIRSWGSCACGGVGNDVLVTKSPILVLFCESIYDIYTVMLAMASSNMDSSGTRLWTKLSKAWNSHCALCIAYQDE